MTRRLVAIPIACALILSAVAAAQPAPKEAMFKVTIKSNLDMDLGQKLKMDADTEFRYTWKRDGKVRTLVVDSAALKVLVGGMEQMNAKMSRDGFADLS